MPPITCHKEKGKRKKKRKKENDKKKRKKIIKMQIIKIVYVDIGLAT